MQLRFRRLLEETDVEESTDIDQESLISLLAKNKALLIKADHGKDPLTVDDFGQFLAGLDLDSYEYVGGAAPRRIIPVNAPGGENMVYTANEAPPDQLIPFHHELAQVKSPPQYIFFYCDKPSDTGGETALIDSTKCFRFANDNYPEFMAKLMAHGARYTRTLPPEDDKTSPIGRSYYNTYQVKSKDELVAKLDAIEGLEYEWLSDGCLKVTSEPIPAVRRIDQQHHHAIYQYTFHNSVIAAFVGWQDSRNDRKKSIRFGNDEEMDTVALEGIARFMEENKVSYKWQKGDIFALNNRLVMHSRNSFTGTRRVYAAMFGDARGKESNPNTPCPKAALTVPDPTIFGFWRLSNPEETVYNAIKNGYRRLDSACDYGNEEATGRGIRRALLDGLCKREDLYITTKLWNTYHDPKHVPLAMEKSLNDLGLDYVDEYLIHFPISMEFVPFHEKYPPEWTNLDGKMVIVPNDINKTWAAMEELVHQGKTRVIGLSNFNSQHIRQVLSVAKIRPTTLQIEAHPHHSQEKLIRFAREEGIRVSVFSPMGATSYLDLNMATKNDVLFENPIITAIAEKHSKTSAQIMLRWALQRNTLPISKSSSPARMNENRNLFDFYLTKEDMDQIASLNVNRRYNDPGVFCEEAFGTYCPIYE